MHARDYRDIFGGGALIAIGGAAAIHALASLRLGTLTNMGPGMFPAAVGGLLAALGIAILVPALFRAGEMPAIEPRPLLAVLGAVLTFYLMVRSFGMIPAIAAMTLVASQADRKLSWGGIVVLAACLSLAATLIFRVGLGLQLVAFAWPW